MFYLSVAAWALLLRGVSGQCTNTATSGCINGVSYDYATEFPCGATMSNGNAPVYYNSTSGCCAQGLPFSLDENYCCYDGIHNWSTGYCGDWSSEAQDPSCYDCTASSTASFEQMVRKLRRSSSNSSTAPIDTTTPNTIDPCYSASSSYGCLNTYPYDWATQYPCYNWILSYSDYGCCQGTPYSLTEDSCCAVEDASTGVWSYEVVSGDAHACSCTLWNCDPSK